MSSMKEPLLKLWDRVSALDPDRVLRALLAGLLILLGVQGVRYLFAGSAMHSLADRAKASAELPARAEQTPMTDYQVILEKDLLGKKAGPSAPPENVYGILGGKVLLGSSPQSARPFAVGASLPSGAVLKEITPTGAVVEKDGSTRTITIFPAIAPMPPSKEGETKPEGENKTEGEHGAEGEAKPEGEITTKGETQTGGASAPKP